MVLLVSLLTKIMTFLNFHHSVQFGIIIVPIGMVSVSSFMFFHGVRPVFIRQPITCLLSCNRDQIGAKTYIRQYTKKSITRN